MKILVPTKRVPDTDQKIRANAAGDDIDDSGLQYMLNPFDAIALEEALRIREGSFADAEIVAVGIGNDGYEQELRTTLAMGADRAVLVECNDFLDPWNVARILESLSRQEQPNLIVMGKQAVDDDSNQAGQFLAALLDWPQATFASKMEFTDAGLRVARETDQGIEVLTTTLPAVVTVDLRLNEPRYASLPSILKAKKKTIDRISLAELGVTLEPRVRLISMTTVQSERNCVKVGSVDELIETLQENKII